MKKILFTLISSVFMLSGIAQIHSLYKVMAKTHIDGDMGWDYVAVDEATNRLYVSHGNMVQVLDLNMENKVIGTITGLNGVHGIAIADDLKKGFISSGKDSSVTIFDLGKLAIINRINITGLNPDAIVYDKTTQRVFTFNGKSKNSTVIDAKTNSIIGTIALPGRPEFCVSDGKGKLYDNLEDKNMVCVIDAATMKIENTWSLSAGEGPSGLAIDTKNRRLFSVCDNKIMVVMDADNGKVITTIPIGERVDAVAFDANNKRIYSSNGEGTLTAIQQDAADKYHIIENVATQKGARTCAVSSTTHHIYLPTAQFTPAPPKSEGGPKPRPGVVPGSFVILDVAPLK